MAMERDAASPDFLPMAHRMLRLLILVFALLLWGASARAAPGDHVFSQGYAAGGIATVDSGGAITAAGTFFGSVDFGGGVLTSVGMFAPDVYVAHFDSSGNHLWSAAFDHANGFGGVVIDAMTTDAAGDVYIAGRLYDGDVDFGGGLLAGSNQLLIVKFSSAGVHQWSALYGDGVPNGIDASAAGIAVAGSTTASLDFGGGAITTLGGRDIFYAVLDPSGAHLRSVGYGNAGNDQSAADVVIDSAGNVTIGGGMIGGVDFGGGVLGAVTADLFLASFDSSGTHRWSQVIAGSYAGGSSVVSVKPRLALHPAGSPLAVAGEMRGSIDFGGGLLSSNGQADVYLARYAADTGAHLSSTNIGGSTSEITEKLSIDSSDNTVITGTMFGDWDAGGGLLGYAGSSDLFVVSLDATDAHLWSASFGTASSDSLGGNSIVPTTGDVVLWGGASSGVDFGGGALTDAQFYIVGIEGNGGGGAAALPSLGPASLLLLAGGVALLGVRRLRSRELD